MPIPLQEINKLNDNHVHVDLDDDQGNGVLFAPVAPFRLILIHQPSSFPFPPQIIKPGRNMFSEPIFINLPNHIKDKYRRFLEIKRRNAFIGTKNIKNAIIYQKEKQYLNQFK